MGKDINMEKVSCSICGSSASKKYCDVKGFNIVSCCNCGLVYINPRYSGEELNKLYGENYFKQFSTQRKVDYMKDRQFRRNDFNTRLKGISRFKKCGKVLDVGCAAGFFLEVARDNGWDSYGVELSDYAASFARDMLKLNVKSGELEGAKFDSNLFDVITLFDVIEHVRDPGRLLKEARRVLKNDGLLVITTPNIDSVCAKVFKDRFHLLDPLHLVYFSPKTMTAMLSKEGFKVIKLEYPYFNTPYFNIKELKNLAWNIANLKLLYPALRYFGKDKIDAYQSIRSYSFYGNMMSVYAVKDKK
ncbi:MAG: class I SAM-dependent methyltransferase [Candidatus Omnitrophica bacterium]|nr:class I SAM-dependent methyltransferase [Candidatus Omnitrophota bacterium]